MLLAQQQAVSEETREAIRREAEILAAITAENNKGEEQLLVRQKQEQNQQEQHRGVAADQDKDGSSSRRSSSSSSSSSGLGLREGRIQCYPFTATLSESKRKRVVVTGGAGFIGSHLVDRLMEEGHEAILRY